MTDDKKIILKLSLEERLHERIEELVSIQDIEIDEEQGYTVGDCIDNIKRDLKEYKEKCVEITSEELELINICLENNKADFEHEGCLPSHKIMLDRIEALLKKLSSFSEGFGASSSPKSSLEESK